MKVLGTRLTRLRWRFVGPLMLLLASGVAAAGTTTYTYDVHGRLTAVSIPNGAGLDRTNIVLTHDAANNLTRVVTSFKDNTPPPVPLTLTANAASSIQINL